MSARRIFMKTNYQNNNASVKKYLLNKHSVASNERNLSFLVLFWWEWICVCQLNRFRFDSLNMFLMKPPSPIPLLFPGRLNVSLGLFDQIFQKLWHPRFQKLCFVQIVFFPILVTIYCPDLTRKKSARSIFQLSDI